MSGPPPRRAPRLLADAMLGRLARWLRVLGLDTGYDPTAHDPELVRWARDEERILLTRDRLLLAELRPTLALLVIGDAPLEQLRQVVTELGLPRPTELFTRCLVCNSELRPADAAPAAAVPRPLRDCPGCGRSYWLGSHTHRMRAVLARTFPEWRLE